MTAQEGGPGKAGKLWIAKGGGAMGLNFTGQQGAAELAGEQEETVKAQVCKDVRCEDWPGAGAVKEPHTQLPRPQPCSSQGTWKDTQHARLGSGSRLSPSSLTLALCCILRQLLQGASGLFFWRCLCEENWGEAGAAEEENGLPVEGGT